MIGFLKRVSVFVTVVIYGLMLNGCMGSSNIKLTPELQKIVDNNTTMYTQFNIFVDTNKILATNYEIGFLLPVNSKIILQSVGTSSAEFIYNNRQIRLVNIEKYTGLNMIQLVNRYFSKDKVDLSRFTNSEQHSIDAAMISDGMSKNAVLVSRGYPPIHVTKTLKRDTWTYWQKGRDKLVVHFNNNRVVKEKENPSNYKSSSSKPYNDKKATGDIPQDKNTRTTEKTRKVKWISEKQTKNCEYVTQRMVQRKKSLLGIPYTETLAKAHLVKIAVSLNANALRITDRQITEGKGKYNRSRLYLYADIYKCK